MPQEDYYNKPRTPLQRIQHALFGGEVEYKEPEQVKDVLRYLKIIDVQKTKAQRYLENKEKGKLDALNKQFSYLQFAFDPFTGKMYSAVEQETDMKEFVQEFKELRTLRNQVLNTLGVPHEQWLNLISQIDERLSVLSKQILERFP